MRLTDLIGADFRDADIRGADLTESIFLTQPQMNSAKGDRNTKLPGTLRVPDHWFENGR
ncbi:pentapeptide repeat-containing protein [Bacillus sp. OVS6]|nr:pentapeptide repeat-containing protein [Bacillus sp. OVS6]